MALPSIKTIECEGTPYEMGLAHGRGAAIEVLSNINMYTKFFAEMAGNITWAQARHRATTIFLPAVEKMWPEILEEMRGIADGVGANLTRDDIFTLNVRTEIAFTNWIDGCTSLSQKTDHGDIFIAQNWDMIPELEHGLVLLHFKPSGTGLSFRMLGEGGLVGKFGMNSGGFGLCLNALRASATDSSHFPVHIMARRLLQYATDVDDAVSILNTYGQASSINCMLADKSGKHMDIECSPLGFSTILPENGFVAHTNHWYGSGRPKGITDHGAPDSTTRLARMIEITERDRKAKVETTYASIRARLSDEHGAPTAICRSLPSGSVGLDRLTTLATIIMELRSGTAKITIGRPCDSLPEVEWTM